VQRGRRGSGIPVDPARVREARLEAGLSLAQLARDDVSRTFIHFVEQGRSRPSRAVLSLIARRTGKPISYFIPQPTSESEPHMDLAAEITRVANRIRHSVKANRLTAVEQEAMKLVELTMHQGAEVAKAVQSPKHRPILP
jgi:transcriptional regulator with XRE-family HTH domain